MGREVNWDNGFVVPESKTTTCKISHITQNTGFEWPCDLESNLHNGFTIGKGKQLYWMMIWHPSGNVSVFTADDGPLRKRWISGDTEITIHFK